MPGKRASLHGTCTRPPLTNADTRRISRWHALDMDAAPTDFGTKYRGVLEKLCVANAGSDAHLRFHTYLRCRAGTFLLRPSVALRPIGGRFGEVADHQNP